MIVKIRSLSVLILLSGMILGSCKKYLDYDSPSKYYPTTVLVPQMVQTLH